MSKNEINNEFTDRTDTIEIPENTTVVPKSVTQNVPESITEIQYIPEPIPDPPSVTIETQNIPETLSTVQKIKPKYEVVFFARYPNSPRPTSEEITNFFNNYGVVHHLVCPDGKNFAIIFMNSLSTTIERRRTRTTISQIIKDMTPENKFYITVANSNRNMIHNNVPQVRYKRNYNNGYNNYRRPNIPENYNGQQNRNYVNNNYQDSQQNRNYINNNYQVKNFKNSYDKNENNHYRKRTNYNYQNGNYNKPQVYKRVLTNNYRNSNASYVKNTDQEVNYNYTVTP